MAKFKIIVFEILQNVNFIETNREDISIDSPGKIAVYDTNTTDVKVLPVSGEMMCVAFDIRDNDNEPIRTLVRCGKTLQQLKNSIKFEYKNAKNYKLEFE